jgi:hypothetical protein
VRGEDVGCEGRRSDVLEEREAVDPPDCEVVLHFFTEGGGPPRDIVLVETKALLLRVRAIEASVGRRTVVWIGMENAHQD